jgi:hypothetical protein
MYVVAHQSVNAIAGKGLCIPLYVGAALLRYRFGQQRDQLFNAPYMVGQACFHCWRHAQSLMNSDKIVIGEVESDCMGQPKLPIPPLPGTSFCFGFLINSVAVCHKVVNAERPAWRRRAFLLACFISTDDRRPHDYLRRSHGSRPVLRACVRRQRHGQHCLHGLGHRALRFPGSG